jgi:small GTP-binding protein
MQDEFKVVMIGEAGVGKTSLTVSLCDGEFDPSSPSTVGCSYLTKTLHLRSQSVTLNVWDTAGQERFNCLLPLYIRNAHGVVFVCDVTAPNPIAGLDLCYEMAGKCLQPHMQLLLCANKVDLVGEDFDVAPLAIWAHARGMEVMKASARTGCGVEAAFTALAAQIAAHAAEIRAGQATDLVRVICDERDGDRGRCC